MGASDRTTSTDPVVGRHDRLKRNVLVAIGTVAVALGMIGVFIPILPTTPFLLVAAYCYARSSRRFYRWLLTNRWCGEYVRNYREGRGIPLKHKIITAALLWLTILYSVFRVVSLWWVEVILLGIAVAVTIHLITIKTYAPSAEV